MNKETKRVPLRLRREEENRRIVIRRNKPEISMFTRMKVFVSGKPLEEEKGSFAASLMSGQVATALKTERSPWILRWIVTFVTRKMGENVAQLFILYQDILTTLVIMTLCWSFIVIIPFCVDPPASFSFLNVSGYGLFGGEDQGLDSSFFYISGYPPALDNGYRKIDWAYIFLTLLPQPLSLT